ncbi:type II secretion system F family protein [soil metagenome]
MILASIGMAAVVPFVVFAAFIMATWAVLSMISQRNSRAQDRLSRLSRPQSMGDIDITTSKKDERMRGFVETAKSLAKPLMPQTELENSALKLELSYAGFRSDSSVAVYAGLRFGILLSFLVISFAVFVPQYGMNFTGLKWVIIITGIGFYMPKLVLWYMKKKRQQAIFLALPDALDLLVVCVESGLGLDAGMRKVCEEMTDHAPVIAEELNLCNFQMQMGRPRREVLHDLGVRTGVDDLRSLSAILIQADRFGSSIAQALRVQSDSMRTRRKQIAEEKAAKTAVQLIFPLVLFIFPGIFVVLVGPAAILIMQNMLNK